MSKLKVFIGNVKTLQFSVENGVHTYTVIGFPELVGLKNIIKVVENAIRLVHENIDVVMITQSPYVIQVLNIFLILYKIKERSSGDVYKKCLEEWGLPDVLLSPEDIEVWCNHKEVKLVDGLVPYDIFYKDLAKLQGVYEYLLDRVEEIECGGTCE